MSNLDELDKELREKTERSWGFIATESKKKAMLEDFEARQELARRYYEAGKLEEREALSKLVLEAIDDYKTRKRMTPFQDTLFNHTVNVLNALLIQLMES